MVTTTTRYLGGLRCEATHGPSRQSILTDAPVDNHGKGEAFSPTDLVAAALSSCALTIMAIAAERHGIVLEGATATTTKEMSKDSPRRIARLATTIRVPLSATHPKRQLLEQSALSCPVHHSLGEGVAAPISFEWVG